MKELTILSDKKIMLMFLRVHVFYKYILKY